MSAEFFTACERLLIATANGVYQGIVVAAIAGLSLRLFPRTNAATRHAVWFGVLLFVTALIPAHLLLSWWSRSEKPTATIRPESSVMTVAPAFAPSPAYLGSAAASLIDSAAFPTPQSDPSDASSADATLNPPSGGNDSRSRSATTATETAWQRFAPALFRPSSWNIERVIRLPHTVSLALVSAWLLLACVRGGLIARRIGEVRRVKITSDAPSGSLQTLFEVLRDSLAARRNVRLRISSTHPAAVVLGFVHPVVLLPTEMDKDANADEVEHVLRHELAHVERRDDWGNLAQQTIQAALFFHPAVWWISAKLSLEREIACDDHVLEASGRPRAYALTLANVASRMNQCRHLLAPGVSNNNSQLQQRITMILNTNRDRSPRLAKTRLGLFTTATAMLAVLAINAGPRLALAQSPLEDPSAPSSDLVAPTPLLNAPLADASPASLPPSWSGADSGPRPKAPVDSDDFGQPALPPPAAPAAPSVLVMPVMPAMPPMAAAEPVPDVSPVPPAPPARPGKRHLSVEERLDRIERMLEDLQARDGAKFRHRSADGRPEIESQNRLSAPAAMAINPNFDFQFKTNFDFQFRIAAQEAKRAAEEAQREVEAGKRDAEKAMRDIAKLKSKDLERMQQDLREAGAEGSLKALDALRTARESLQTQMQAIEQQIKRLEEEQKQQKDQQRGRDERRDDGSKQEQPAPEKIL